MNSPPFQRRSDRDLPRPMKCLKMRHFLIRQENCQDRVWLCSRITASKWNNRICCKVFSYESNATNHVTNRRWINMRMERSLPDTDFTFHLLYKLINISFKEYVYLCQIKSYTYIIHLFHLSGQIDIKCILFNVNQVVT